MNCIRIIFCTLFLLATLLLSVTAQAAGTLSVTYYHNDATGSPVAATNQQGQVVWRKVYTPYGEASGRDRDNRIGYTGHVEDANGLIFAGARYYDPMLGRFLSTDPVGFSESNLMSFNRYAYANNNPFKYVDPDGRDPVVGGFSYSSGYLPHYGVDQKTVDRMTTGLAGATVALGLGAGAAIAFPAEAAVVASAEETVNAAAIRKSAEKGIRSLEKRIAEHEKKLADFKESPTVRPGMEGQSESVIKAAQESRISHLEKEINTFRDNIKKLMDSK